MAFSRFIAGSRQGTRATAGILAAFLPTLMGSTAVSQTTGAVPPGVAPCITNAVPAGYGTLLLVGSASFAQTGDTAPAEAATPSPLVTAEVTSPSAFVVSNALVASTKGFSLALASIGQGRSLGATQYVSEAALLGSLSAGNYNASFQLAFPNGETFVGFSVFGVASNLPPVPQISAFAAAQSIDASAPFALNWLPWIGSGTNDRIALVIADAAGNAVVSAATDCSGTTDLPVGATGFTIPAGRLAAGTSYTGYLTFESSRTASVDDGALLLQRVFQARTTRFSLRTATSGGGGQPGTLSNIRVSASALTMTLSGVPGTTYAIQASPDLFAWAEQTRATVPASGTTDVTLPLPPPNTPRYYRAVAVGGGTTPDTQIRLQIAAQSATRMRITVQGPSGTTHTVESTTNLVAWSPIGTVTIPEGSTNISFVTSVPAGSRGGIFRSRSDDVVTPPVGNRPTLSASASAAGLQVSLAGGDANRTYVVQQAGASLASWSATTFTITTGGTGAGQVIVTPLPGNSGIFRVEAR